MATTPKEKTLEDLVTEGWELTKQIRSKQEELAKINQLIVAQGGGARTGTGGSTCTVVVPNPGIKPTKEDIEVCKKIAGSAFSKIFKRTVSFSAVEGFRQVVAAVLSKAKAAKVISQCEKTASSFVIWPK